MNSYYNLPVKLAWPMTAGGGAVQSTDTYDYLELGQNFEYIIFVFKANAWQSPVKSWPRTVDTRGTWYYAGKTSNTYAVLNLPKGLPLDPTFSVWVGFGNKDTLRTCGLPFNIDSDIYMEEQ